MAATDAAIVRTRKLRRLKSEFSPPDKLFRMIDRSSRRTVYHIAWNAHWIAHRIQFVLRAGTAFGFTLPSRSIDSEIDPGEGHRAPDKEQLADVWINQNLQVMD